MDHNLKYSQNLFVIFIIGFLGGFAAAQDSDS